MLALLVSLVFIENETILANLTVWVSQMLFCINIQMVWHVFKNREKAGVCSIENAREFILQPFWIFIFVWFLRSSVVTTTSHTLQYTINILNWQNKKSNSDALELLLIDQIVLWQFFILCCDTHRELQKHLFTLGVVFNFLRSVAID